MKRWTNVIFGLGVLAVSMCGVARAAEVTEQDKLSEQSIYVPYEKLWQVFEKKGRGVFLPYEEFMTLWRAAADTKDKPPVTEPPVPAVIAEVSGEATVQSDVMAVSAVIRIELLKEGWHRIPIGLGDVAITEAGIAGQDARLVREGGGGYTLLYHAESADVGRSLLLNIQFAKAFEKAPGRNSVSFSTPVAPVSRWEIRIPERGVRVDVHPMLAATDVPVPESEEATRVLAFVGATPSVRVEWTPKAEGAKGLQALANVKAEHEVRIDEGVVRNRVRLTYEISRTELSELRFSVPTGHKVVNVFDANVREWSVAAGTDGQDVTVQLFEPTKGIQSLIVELERFSEEAAVAVPMVRALNVARQQGIVVAALGSGLRGEATHREGLLQLDASELPRDLSRGSWAFSYRYAALPFGLSFGVEKVKPRVTVHSLQSVSVQPEEQQIDFVAACTIERAGVFSLQFSIPDGYDVRLVEGVAHGGMRSPDVDRHHIDGAGSDRTLTVNFGRKATGLVGVRIRLERALHEPDLLSPTGKYASVPVPFLRAGGAFVERDTGGVIVYGPESLRLNPADVQGLRVVSRAEAAKDMPSPIVPTGTRAVLAFMRGAESASLSLMAERRAPHVTVGQMLTARIDAGVVRYTCDLHYDVRYSGVKVLRLDVPTQKAALIRVTTPEIRQAEFSEAPDSLDEGYTAWRLEGETEFLGARTVRLEWEEKLENLDIGETVTLQVPSLRPAGVDRAWGQVVLAKAETIDVSPASVSPGLRPIDPGHDLMAGARVPDAAQAFEFHSAWALSVRATRYEPKDVKATSVERGLVRMVMTRSDVTSVQALYRIRSARQRLLLRLPGDVQFDTQPLRLNGRPVSLEQGDPGDFYVPLVGQKQDEPFLLELRYVIQGAGHTASAPEFPREPAAQRVFLSVFLPREQAYLGFRGPWTPEMVWASSGIDLHPKANRDSDSLLSWVCKGLNMDVGQLKTFATDGRQHLFSSLRPGSGDEAALHISAIRRGVLQAMLLGAVILFGLVLLPACFRVRVSAVAAGCVAAVVVAIFAPSFIRTAVNAATIGAVFIVAMVWGVWFLVVTVPRSRAWQEWRESRNAQRNRRRTPPGPPVPPLPQKSADTDATGDATDVPGGSE